MVFENSLTLARLKFSRAALRLKEFIPLRSNEKFSYFTPPYLIPVNFTCHRDEPWILKGLINAFSLTH